MPPPHPPQLFNIADDPEEQINLAEELPDRIGTMLAELEEWFERIEAERATIGDIWHTVV